ncbi:hypothetical protein [Sphaerisporangium krabiense]|uniref:Uncharacterized protein n=1 Tax=Sphaerisporangium krabiense TaxID=763782 RepID=A0A7W8ZAN2_9ACTN|nr:hypothetical protein [Sphaerisporangium krabiense]MBB5630499.1 hypothetical protein [Sphaerisporangium krabiense]
MERRHFLRVTGGLAGAALLTSCTGPGEDPPSPDPGRVAAGASPPAGDVLYADVSTHLSAVDAATGATILSLKDAVPGADQRLLYSVTAANALITLDARTGRTLTRTSVPPGLVARAVAPSGTVVALAAPAPASPYGGPGRRETTVVVADPSGDRPPKTLRLKGNFEPDSFSLGGTALFVLEYLPATRPDRYRVRVCDLDSGTLGPLLTREKKPVPPGAEETMRGEGRVAVLAPDHRRLYTLYTHQPGHLHTRDLVAGRGTGVHAFVHVLDLEQRWAYCLDLPEPFGRGAARGHALAVHGGALFVYDAASGTVVRAGTDTLRIERTARIDAAGGTASAVAAGVRLYVAAGSSVQVVDGETLKAREEWRLPGTAAGIATGQDGVVYAGVPGTALRFEARDGAGGRETSRTPIAGMTALRFAVPAV